MGQVCSTEHVELQTHVMKDPSDQELAGDLSIQKTNLAEFDSFFEKAFAPILEMREMHDSIFRTQEKIKEEAALVQGQPQVILTANSVEFDNDIIEMGLYVVDEKGNPVQLQEQEATSRMAQNEQLHEVYEKTKAVLANLNDDIINTTAENLTRWIFFEGRVKITESGKNDAGIQDLNNMLFKLKKEIAQAANISKLSQAIQLFHSKSQLPLAVKTEEDGTFKFVKDGEEVQLNKMDLSSVSMTRLSDAILELQERTERVSKGLSSLATEASKNVQEAKDLPKKVAEAGNAQGFSAQEIRKAESAAHENVKNLSHGASLAKSTFSAIQHVGREVATAFSVPIGA